MNSDLATFHQFSTIRTLGLLEELTAEEWFAQPAGFSNNIAWNAGHLLLVRQNLIYKNSGMETNMDGTGRLYKAGSSPADWESQPDIAQILELLKSQTDRLIVDAKAGAFADVSYPSFELAGNPVDSLDGAATFNLWHEALHGGVIMSIRDVLRQ